MGIEIYVDLYVGNSSTVLLKRLNNKHLEGSFRDLIDYIIDPDKDDLNLAYEGAHKDVAEGVYKNLKQAENDENYRAELSLLDKNDEEVQVNLWDKVSDYTKRALKDEVIKKGKDEITIKKLDLLLTFILGGGRYFCNLNST